MAGLPPASRETKRFHTWLDRGIESLAFAHFVAKTFARGSGGPHGGHILVLAGPTGVGKTHLALACGWEWFDDGMSVYFARVDDLLDELRRGLGDETYHQKLEYFKTCDLLVLDDLGAEHSRDWAEEKLDRIIDWRYVNREAMVVTTNARREDLAPRIASRLADHRASLVVQLDASDYRSGAQ